MPLWINNPAWTLLERQHAGQTLLVLTAGSDESYIVDEAGSDDAVRRILAAWRDDRLAGLLDDPDCGAAVRQLQRAGALIPARAVPQPGRYALTWLGAPVPVLADALDAAGPASMPLRVDDADAASLLLIVRTNASWQEALSLYQTLAPKVPHLFVDVAYHHMVAVGPYVVPGETACMGCLGHRVAHRWGDLAMPAEPAAASRPRLLAELLAPLLAVRAGLFPFIEHSISLNLQTLASTNDRVFRFPWCPVCRATGDEPAGMLHLPWLSVATDGQG
uniref:TOMM precursor leader peptide-binding protein n=1 Tax=Castellaniella defragrans TaxID=75697 RepID=UPI003341CA46